MFVIAVCSALSASAQELKIESFRPETLSIVGSYCQFGARWDALLISDWDKKFWMKVVGLHLCMNWKTHRSI